MVVAKKKRKPVKRRELGASDRYPSDYGVRTREDRKSERPPKNRSWVPGDKGQGREGLSKGYGGSGGRGTGASGPEEEQRRASANRRASPRSMP